MTIYIATTGEYSEFRICAVFTDKKQAEFYCATHEYECEEWEADAVEIDTTKTPKQLWRATFHSSGEMRLMYSDYLTFRDINKIETKYGLIYAYATLGVDIDEERAKKVICDRVAQWRYEQSQKKGLTL